MPDTATTRGAWDHARSQAGRIEPSMRTVPAALAGDLPCGVGGPVVWDERLGPGRSTTKVLAPGCRLSLTDLDGEACAQLLAFNALAPHERLNVADTVKVQWQAYLGQGSLLLTDMGRVLATIVTDTSGHHDTFCGPSCDPARGVADRMPSARALLLLGVARHGLDRRDIHPCVNFFKGVRVREGGALEFTGGAGPGARVVLRAELPTIVVLANTPHVLDERPDPPCTPLHITAWRGPATGTDDRWRLAGPEGRRAFENTEDYLAGHPLADAWCRS